MDLTIAPLSTLRVASLAALQGNKQDQRPPFSPGQIIHVLVTGKTNENQFILETGGRQFIADTQTNLQVGQQLNLQVTALQPSITMRTVGDQLTQIIGKSLNLLNQQKNFLPSIQQLFEETSARSSSLPTRQGPLELFSQLAQSQPINHAPPVALQSAEGISHLIVQLSQADSPQKVDQVVNELKTVLGHLLNTTVPSALAKTLSQQVLALLSSPETVKAVHAQRPVALQPNQTAGKQPVALADVIQQLAAHRLTTSPTAANLNQFAGDMLTFINKEGMLPPSPLFNHLLELVLHLTTEKQLPPEGFSIKGEDIRSMTEKMGLNVERLLADDKPQAAIATLKNALLDIMVTGKSSEQQNIQTGELVKTIELYQMLQIRLASEALFFLPLPLPFFEQAYLLVEQDPPDKPQALTPEQGKKYTLHLQMKGLGNLIVEIAQEQQTVSLRFQAENQDIASFLSTYRAELKHWLTAAELGSVDFTTGAADPARHLLQQMLPTSTGLLDTKI